MLREILFALDGHIGDLFSLIDDEIKFIGENKYLTSGEEAMINKILVLGGLYVKINRFIESDGDGKYCGMLKLSLSHVLEDYRNDLLDLEKLFFDGYLCLTTIFSRVQKYRPLFCSMISFINEVSNDLDLGCNILSILYKYTSSGIEICKSSWTRILKECSELLYSQLFNWLLHGILVNDTEFFIEEMDVTFKATKAPESGQVTPLDLSVWETNYDNFKLRIYMIPKYIKLDTAEKILFIGQSVLLLRNKYFNPKGTCYLKNLYDMKSDFEQTVELSNKSEYFSFAPIEQGIDKMAGSISEQLYSIVVEDGKLLSELLKLKELYLLGRGELFWMFIRRADPLLSSQVTLSENHNHELSCIFHVVCQQMLMEENFYDNITVSLISHSGEDMSGWSQLKIAYPITPPLKIFFSESIIDKYNHIMCFLIEVRRSHMVVLEAWKHLLKSRLQRRCDNQLWQLVNHMLFIISNLQQYFMADVLEVHSTELMHNILDTRDFGKIRSWHELFLNNIQAEVFLFSKLMIARLRGMLNVCNSLAYEVTTKEATSVDLESCQQQLQKELSFFFRVLCENRNTESRLTYNQLTLRLDFNKYFTKTFQ